MRVNLQNMMQQCSGIFVLNDKPLKQQVMKTNILMLMAGLLFSSFICTQAAEEGSSADKKVEREVPRFTKLELSVAANLYLKQGDTQSLVLEGDADKLEDIETVVHGGKLKIKHNKPFHFGSSKRITIYVTMKEIEALSVGGSGRIEAETPIQAEDLELNVSGSGDIHIGQLEASEVESSISGSGDIHLAGNNQVNTLECDISGSGELHASGLEVENAELNLSGSGSCKVYVMEELDVDISGSGKVRYKGEPRVNASISGSGRVEAY